MSRISIEWDSDEEETGQASNDQQAYPALCTLLTATQSQLTLQETYLTLSLFA